MGVGCRLVWLVIVAVSGCVAPAAIQCDDGRVCPADTTCDAEHGLCISEQQTDACNGKVDGESCQFVASVGRCDGGVCIQTACGNGVVDSDEACDDGNVDSGDGCRADCQKIEMCGDAVADVGEACDDGNDNSVDGCDMCIATAWSATPVIGGNPTATTVDLGAPEYVAVDGRGDVYVSDGGSGRVLRIANGIVSVAAGTGIKGFSGDGGPAIAAQLRVPRGLAVDGVGNLFIADSDPNNTPGYRVRRVAPDGIITTVAGTGVQGFSGDGGPATNAELNDPRGLAVDGLGNLFIADSANHRIRRVDTNGFITTVAGSGSVGAAGDGGLAVAAELNYPVDVKVAGNGDLYIVDGQNHRIRKVSGGMMSKVAGTTFGYSGDGSAASSAQLDTPYGVAVAADGTLFIGDSQNRVIRQITPAGAISTIAGTGTTQGFTGDGGPAASALLAYPQGLALYGGTLYIADQLNGRVRTITSGTINTLGGGAEGGAATGTTLADTESIAYDSQGRLHISVTGDNRVVRVEPDGTLHTIAGTGAQGYSGDGGEATKATFYFPGAITFDGAGNLYIVDRGNNVIRRVTPAGLISTIAGNGVGGYNEDGIAPTAASLYDPSSIAFDLNGNLHIADTLNHRIRKITGNVITTVAGNGTGGDSGDTNAATSAMINSPSDITFDAAGKLYIADTGNHRIRKVDAGTITTVAGDGTAGYTGDNAAATSAKLRNPAAIVFDSQGRLVISDAGNSRIRRVSGTTITTIGGVTISKNPLDGDGGPATSALVIPRDMVSRPEGLVIADSTRRIRRIDAAGVITSIAGQIDPEGVGILAQARLADPRALVDGPGFTLFAGGSSGTVQALRAASLDAVAGRYPNLSATSNLARFRARTFGSIGGVAYEASPSTIYITEGNSVHAITVVDVTNPNTWTIATVAPSAGFLAPTALYLDAATRTLYVADTGNQVIRTIDLATAATSTIAGSSRIRGFGGDGAAATSARLNNPQAITRCPNGDLFIADTGNNRVRRVAGGAITTVLGDGSPSSSGEGSPSTSFSVHGPLGLACDASNNLYVTSTTSVRLLPARTGIVDGTGSVQTIFGAQPRTMFPSSVASCLTGIRSIDTATVRVTDSCTGMLIELKRQPTP